MASTQLLRIGELSKRSGVSPELLRAWERRYGLLRPERSPGGLRLYTSGDLERVRVMQQHLADGLAAAEAAALAVGGAEGPDADAPVLLPDAVRDDLAEALARFDEPEAQAILDRALALSTVDGFLTEIVLPYLGELGRRWEQGEVSVAQEHFASAVLRGRLLGLARGWGRGIGPLAILACLPGEHHDLGLISLGLALRARGWRIAYIGPDTPVATVAEASRELEPAFVILSGIGEDHVLTALPELRALARRCRVALGGAAAGSPALKGTRVLALPGDPVSEGDRLTALVQNQDAR
jgi:MerR family transcriptional regulator, light-induced transcriptional regulator